MFTHLCVEKNTLISHFWRPSPQWLQWTALSSADGSWRTTPAAFSSGPPSAPGLTPSPSLKWLVALSSHWWRWRVLLLLWADVVENLARSHTSQVSLRLPQRAQSRKSRPRRCGSILCWCQLGRVWARSGPKLSDSASVCLLSPGGATWNGRERDDGMHNLYIARVID